MTWVAIAVGGAAVIGAGASYAGSQKQASAAKKAAQLNMDQFGITNAQQQPFIQSGYGAMGKLNTLLGINPNPNARASMPMTGGTGGSPQPVQQAWAPTQGGGVDPRMQMSTGGTGNTQLNDMTGHPPARWNVPEANMPNLQLRNILSLRAQNGDRQAQYMLQRLG